MFLQLLERSRTSELLAKRREIARRPFDAGKVADKVVKLLFTVDEGLFAYDLTEDERCFGPPR